MTGEYQHSLDNKGRLFIPAKLRDELGDVFFITLSMDRCLSAYSSEAWQDFSDKVSAMPYVKQRKMRPLFAHAARCELDAQGRVLIPKTCGIMRASPKMSPLWAATTMRSCGTAPPGTRSTARKPPRRISPR